MRIFLILLLAAATVGVNAQSTRAWQTFESGMNASRAGDHATALAGFQKALGLVELEGSSDEFASKVHYNVGVSYYRLREREKAVTAYERAIVLSRRNYEKAFYALGLVLAELKNWQAAEKAFRGAISNNRRNGEAWFDLAFVYLATGENEKAQKAFASAIKFGTVDAAISHNNLGVLLAIKSDFRAAEVQFAEAVARSNGSFAGAAANLTKCREITGGKVLIAQEFEIIYRNTDRKT
ncbi:MAG TPA: tetratricopeptide repeat protein [Pyrinomonadaceae bacterium]|nr:tetratricopeptide repeat protein [Pyrinomonadaceae bacterium]